jgi:hypothetical protein
MFILLWETVDGHGSNNYVTQERNQTVAMTTECGPSDVGIVSRHLSVAGLDWYLFKFLSNTAIHFVP